MFFDVVVIIAAMYMIFIGSSMESQNMRSKLIFNMLPIVLGFLLGLLGLINFGVV